MIGLLGEDVTGEVNECDYDGQRVAVKLGLKNYSSKIDCMRDVENEMAVYKILKDLQGSVIPRMIEGGLNIVCSAGIALITKKVGMEVKETDREVTVGGKPLDRETCYCFNGKDWRV